MDDGPTAHRVEQPAAWKLWTALILRWVLAILFIWAGSLKIVRPELFAEAVHYYHILPMEFVNWTVIFLPWLEVVCGIALLTGVCERGAAMLVIPMMLIFIFALGYSIHRGLDINCGCFGLSESGKRIGFLEIGRNLMILLAAVAILTFSPSTDSNPGPQEN